MKVLLVNGSPNREGCTYTALSEIAGVLNTKGIETEIFQLGTAPVYGCIACYKCKELKKCVLDGDIANALSEKILQADGIVIGSPVYFAGPNGALCAVLDRVFFSSWGAFENKPAAGIVSCRRSGSTASFDRLNKYFTIFKMPVVTSQYWNAVHGSTPDEVRKDKEGMQVMRVLGNNMAWMLKLIEVGGPPPPLNEKRETTDFINN